MLVCKTDLKYVANHIEEMPYENTPILSSGLFQFKGLPINEAYIELERMSATLIPTSPWCCPKDVNHFNPLERQRFGPFEVPHTERSFAVRLCDFQGSAAYGLPGFGSGLLDISGVAVKQFESLGQSMRLLQEYRFVNALKGTVLDADGQTVMIDLFQKLGLTQRQFNWDFASASFDIDIELSKLTKYIVLALKGGAMAGGTIYLHSDDFDCLTQIKKLEAWIQRCCEQAALLNDVKGSGMNRTMRRGKWTFQEYISSEVLNPFTGVSIGDFVEKGKPLVVPEVTGVEMYEMLVAPPVRNDTVHQVATQLIYTDFAPIKDSFENESGWHGKVEMNMIPIVKRIGAIPAIKILGC